MILELNNKFVLDDYSSNSSIKHYELTFTKKLKEITQIYTGNACYHSGLNVLSRNVNIKIHKL